MPTYEKTKVFTTGQISKICQVAPRTVSKWFDTGHLRGYRIPGSNDRRVPRENLVTFMRDHGMPLGPLAEGESAKVLLVSVGDSTARAIRNELPADTFEVQSVATAFEAGMQANAWKPDSVVIDAAMGRQEANATAKGLRQLLGKDAPLLFALMSQDMGEADIDSSLFDDRFRAPFDVALLGARIRQAIGRAPANGVETQETQE